MKRYLLRVAYDGTAYSGYQSQINAQAVQDVLEAALKDLFGGEIRTVSASRTDTGVHARGNVVCFDCETQIAAGRIAFALNARLPEDIRIVESKAVPQDFHPRFTETVKTYSYHILNRTHPDPIGRHRELHIYDALDVAKMRSAAQYLIGEHDFASFCAAGFSGNTTVRTIYDASLEAKGDRLTFTITGNGFLYNMVRIIVGTLLMIGRDAKRSAAEMQDIILACDRAAAGPTAPAKGLILEEIEYPNEDL